MSSNDNDNNNTNSEGGKTRSELPLSAARERARYHEEALLNTFSRMVHSSATVGQVCDYFKIGRVTYYRWLRKVAARERHFMKRNFDDVLTNEVVATAEQFKHAITIMNTIMNSETAMPADKVDAAKLAGEFRLALLRLYDEGVTSAWISLPHQVKRVITTEEYEPPKKALMHSLDTEQEYRTGNSQ